MRASAGVVQAAEASTVTGARHPRSRCAAAAPRSRSRVDKGGAGLVGRRRRRRQVEPRPRDAQRAGQVGGLQHDRRGARREGVERVARREAKRVAKAGQERLIATRRPSLPVRSMDDPPCSGASMLLCSADVRSTRSSTCRRAAHCRWDHRRL